MAHGSPHPGDCRQPANHFLLILWKTWKLIKLKSIIQSNFLRFSGILKLVSALAILMICLFILKICEFLYLLIIN